jgi:hypothetical protein
MSEFKIHYVAAEDAYTTDDETHSSWASLTVDAKSEAQAEAIADITAGKFGWFTWFVERVNS